MPDVLKENPNTTLVMTGWGDRTSTLKSLSKELGVDENIIFLGRVSNPYSVYYHADVVAFPSRFEGFSISMLKAMAFAKPIVATSIGPFVEALGENHQYVDFGDAAGLSEHITRYLKNESVAVQDGERAKSRVQSLFSGSVGADKHYNLYQSLI
jgi:glycosyltransferase involved in cell wall biosynthesis